MFSIIDGAVGTGGKNSSHDVKTVRILLNMNISKLSPLEPLSEDGSIGPKTIAAIEAFQKTVVMTGDPDGKVIPGGETVKKLAEGIPDSFCDRIAPSLVQIRYFEAS